MRLYIRHARKSYRDGEKIPLHDSDLHRDIDIGKCYDIIGDLVKEYGLPDQLISSPYLRTRMTTQIFHDILKELYHVNTPIIIDSNISEFVGFRKHESLSVTNKTLSYGIPDTTETMNELIERIDYHDEMFKNINMNIWIFSHGKIMGHIYKKYYGNQKRKLFNYLDSFSVK